MKKIIIVASLLALSGLSTAAMAADASSNWFVRAEGGTSQLSVSGVSGHGNSNTFNIRTGYNFNQYFGVEGFYTQLADKSDSTYSVKVTGWGIGGVVKKNFGDNNTGFYIDGRAGLLRSDLKVSVSGLGHASENSTKGYFGVGAGYDFSHNVGMGLNYDYNDLGFKDLSGSIGTVTLDVEYRF